MFQLSFIVTVSISLKLYLLKYYPSFPRITHVVERLIEAYYLNQQPELAKKMEKILESLQNRKLLVQINKME